MDSTLWLATATSRPTINRTFTEIAKSIAITHSTSIELRDLLQILTVWPEAYIIEWASIDCQRDLKVSLPNDLKIAHPDYQRKRKATLDILLAKYPNEDIEPSQPPPAPVWRSKNDLVEKIFAIETGEDPTLDLRHLYTYTEDKETIQI